MWQGWEGPENLQNINLINIQIETIQYSGEHFLLTHFIVVFFPCVRKKVTLPFPHIWPDRCHDVILSSPARVYTLLLVSVQVELSAQKF